MEYLAAGVSSLMSVFLLAVFVAGVMKLFQIHTVLLEIKDSMRSGSVSHAFSVPSVVAPVVPVAPEALHAMGSGDEMLRALDAQIKWDETSSRTEIR